MCCSLAILLSLARVQWIRSASVKLSTGRKRGREGKVNRERKKQREKEKERERERERERESAYKVCGANGIPVYRIITY